MESEHLKWFGLWQTFFCKLHKKSTHFQKRKLLSLFQFMRNVAEEWKMRFTRPPRRLFYGIKRSYPKNLTKRKKFQNYFALRGISFPYLENNSRNLYHTTKGR